MEDQLSFEFEVVDELPSGRDRVSNYDETIQAFMRSVETGLIKPTQAAVLRHSEKKESIAAIASGLKDRYGPVTANGMTFASRPYHLDNTQRAIYMSYDPSKVVPGESEKHAEARKEKLAKMNERAKAKAKEKAAANPTSGNTEGGKNGGAGKQTVSKVPA